MLRSLSILTLGALVSLTACSSSDDGGGTTPTDTGTTQTDTGTTPTDTGSGGDDTGTAPGDTGTATDTGAAGETGGDTGPAAVQGCAATDFVDATTDASKRTITWANPVHPCIKIKKGQSVTWSGVPSAFHPLEAAEGDTPSPITNVSVNTFPNAGTFGFHCTNHPLTMKGAIMVVE